MNVHFNRTMYFILLRYSGSSQLKYIDMKRNCHCLRDVSVSVCFTKFKVSIARWSKFNNNKLDFVTFVTVRWCPFFRFICMFHASCWRSVQMWNGITRMQLVLLKYNNIYWKFLLVVVCPFCCCCELALSITHSTRSLAASYQRTWTQKKDQM